MLNMDYIQGTKRTHGYTTLGGYAINHFRMVCIPKYLTMILYFEIVETFRATSHNGRPSEKPLPNLPIFLVKKRNSQSQNSQKYCHVGILERILFQVMASCMKAQKTNLCSPPIKLLEFLLFLTFGHCVKQPFFSFKKIPKNNSMISIEITIHLWLLLLQISSPTMRNCLF